MPLFLGTDVLSGCPKLRKNHGRIHARFAKEGLASKVTLNHSNSNLYKTPAILFI